METNFSGHLQEKRKHKNFMMMRHNKDVRGKNKRSFRDKQVGSFKHYFFFNRYNRFCQSLSVQ